MSPEERAYYQAVEDLFARLRGTPFLISPKDYALMRRWWSESVPLAAVVTAIGEVFERRRERQEDPVSSLSYCRHAVARHAKRLARAAAGSAGQEAAPGPDAAASLARLAGMVRLAAERWGHAGPVAAVLGDLERALATLPVDAAPDAIDETLGRLEVTTLLALAALLPDEGRKRVEAEVSGELSGLDLADDVRARTERALRLKILRETVGLPRLELASGGA